MKTTAPPEPRSPVHTPHLDRWLQCLERAADTGDQAAAANGRDDGNRVGCVLENLEAQRTVPRNEVLIIERVNEGPGNARKGPLAERSPGGFIRHRQELRAKRPHAFDLCRRRGFDRDHRARYAGLSRGIRNALPGVARTDGPDAEPSFGFGQHGDCIHSTPQLVRVGGL